MFLFRGGRLSRTSAIVGGALGMKPILHVNNEGRLEKVEVARGRKASIKRMYEKMKASITSAERIYISHGDCIDDANQLRDMIIADNDCKDMVVDMIGPVIGSHAGPGTLALFFIGKER
jgi:DegV family protein with EDD domain